MNDTDRQQFEDQLTRITLCGLFAGTLAVAYFIMGCAGLLGSPIVNPIIGTCTVGFLTFGLYQQCKRFSFSSKSESALSIAILLLILISLALCFLPPIAKDELNQHLALPKLYAQHGKIIVQPVATYSYYPMLLNMLFTPWVAWKVDFFAKFIHFSFALLTSVLIAGYISYRQNKVYGLLGGLVFLSTPIVIRTSTAAYVDLGLTFYCFASILCFCQYTDSQNSKWLYYSGLLSGCAAATKPNGGICVIILAVIWLISGLWNKKDSSAVAIKNTLMFLLLSSVFCLPWLIRNFWDTQNPFYPFLQGLFSLSKAPLSPDMEDYMSIGGLERRFLIYGESIWEVLALPIRIFLFGRDGSPKEFDGLLNPIFLVCLPFAFKKRSGLGPFIAFVGVYFCCAVFLTVLRVRYLIPILPPLCIILTFGLETIIRNRRFRFVAVIGIVLCMGLNLRYLASYVGRVSPFAYFIGTESRENYLSRLIPYYKSVRFVNQNLSDTAKVYLVLSGRQGYYLDREYYIDREELPDLISNAIKKGASGSELAFSLKAEGITHLLIRTDLFERFATDNFSQRENLRFQDFLNQEVNLLFTDNLFRVYEIIFL